MTVFEKPDGSKEWRQNGHLHREDGPAIEYANGSKEWWLNGQRHRENGPAVEYAIGSKFWYKNGKCHREDGPAIECANGIQEWWINGQRHREDGPAVITTDNTKYFLQNQFFQPQKDQDWSKVPKINSNFKKNISKHFVPGFEKYILDVKVFEPTKRTVVISNKRFLLSFPYQIFFEINKKSLYLLFSDKNPFKPNVKLYCPPLPNIYIGALDDGLVCLDINNHEMTKFERSLIEKISIFWESEFILQEDEDISTFINWKNSNLIP